MAFIYKITNDVNGKVYIGKTLHSKDGKFLRSFASEADAMRFLGKRSSTGHISCVCNGKRKTAYGYVWKYHSI